MKTAGQDGGRTGGSSRTSDGGRTSGSGRTGSGVADTYDDVARTG